MEGLSLLGIGPDDGALYFDGHRIVFTRELKLTDTQKWIAVIAAVGVFLSGVGAVLAAIVK